jgi:hypothetical protein
MRYRSLYAIFSALVLLLFSVAELRGWSLDSTSETLNVPHTVRDNPGSYRPAYLYSGSGRYLRGK